LPAPTRLVLDFMLSVLPRSSAADNHGGKASQPASASAGSVRQGGSAEEGEGTGAEGGGGGTPAGGRQQLRKQDDGGKKQRHKAKSAAGLDAPTGTGALASLPASFKVPPLYADFSAL
jgi:hypothetical protein